jgi:2-polyprenyl-3-methyl-5-hydroxy-6-metoxy-1,4-benzoquinol methylase
MSEDIQQKNFEQLSEAHEYYRWLTDVMRPWIGGRLLEVGCGQGNITVNLLDREYVCGVDMNSEYLHFAKDRFREMKNFEGVQVDITDPNSIKELRSRHFSTVIAVNVVEHIKDDVSAVRAMREIIQDEGTVILLVPAFDLLMSPYDRMVGHYRRYTKATLEKTMSEAGFVVEKVFYFNMIGAFGWWLNYVLLKRTIPGTGAVALLERLVPLQRKIESIISPPFGISVIAIGRKSE